jgi:hypothetical protein
MAFGGEHHAADANSLICVAPVRSSSRAALRTSAVPSAITDMFENGPIMAAGIDCLVGRPKIGAAAGLGQRLSRIEQPRADDVPLREQPGGRVIGTAGLADGRVTVHQAVAQVVCRRDRDFRGGIGDVLWRQRQPGDVGVGVNQPGHQRPSANIDDRRFRCADRLRRHRHDAGCPSPGTSNEGCSSSNPSRTRLALVEKRVCHRFRLV